jgi:hypothetical protein
MSSHLSKEHDTSIQQLTITITVITIDENKLTGHDRVFVRSQKTYMAERLVSCDIFDSQQATAGLLLVQS